MQSHLDEGGIIVAASHVALAPPAHQTLALGTT